MKQICINTFSFMLAAIPVATLPGVSAAQEAAVAAADSATENEAPNNQEQAEKESADKIPVLSLPYQGIYRSVPQAKLDTATSLLQKELGTLGNLNIIRGAIANSDAKSPSLEKFQASSASAKAAEVSGAKAAEFSHHKNSCFVVNCRHLGSFLSKKKTLLIFSIFNFLCNLLVF